MKDTYRHKGLRKKLVKIIREKGIKDEAVLKAIEKIPRHFFLDNAFVESSYKDKAFPIGEGQTISQPFTVAYQTQLLNIKEGDKVLEIGTGSGYQASVLAELGARVYSIERQKALFERSKKMLDLLGYNVKVVFGDGHEGLPAFAPFDKIIVTAASTEIPIQLITQMKVNGFLVIPLGNKKIQKMVRIIKSTNNEQKREEWDYFKFVPMLKGKVW